MNKFFKNTKLFNIIVIIEASCVLLTEIVLLSLFFSHQLRLTSQPVFSYWYFHLIYLFVAAIIVALCVLSLALSKNPKKCKQSVTFLCVGVLLDVVITFLLINTLTLSKWQVPPDYYYLMQKRGDQLHVHYWTKSLQTTHVGQNDLDFYSTDNINDSSHTPNNKKTYYHNVLVPMISRFIIPQLNVTVDPSIPANITKFVVHSDIHGEKKYAQLVKNDFDFRLIAGDVSALGMDVEFADSFFNSSDKVTVFAVGNHDQRGAYEKITQRNLNYFESFNNICIINLYVLSDLVQRIDPARKREALQLINDTLTNTDFEHYFIQVHQPIYSIGEFGGERDFTEDFNQLLDQFPHKPVRAVFTGHDHYFGAYKRKGVYYFVVGGGGGKLEGIEDADGPIDGYGGEFHIKSVNKFMKMEVCFNQNGVEYVVKELESDLEIARLI